MICCAPLLSDGCVILVLTVGCRFKASVKLGAGGFDFLAAMALARTSPPSTPANVTHLTHSLM